MEKTKVITLFLVDGLTPYYLSKGRETLNGFTVNQCCYANTTAAQSNKKHA